MSPKLPSKSRRVKNWIGVIVGPFAALTIWYLGLDQPNPLVYNLEAIIVLGGWIYLLILAIKMPREPRE
jgi:hypothetical protein